jgi:hypothetical protein
MKRVSRFSSAQRRKTIKTSHNRSLSQDGCSWNSCTWPEESPLLLIARVTARRTESEIKHPVCPPLAIPIERKQAVVPQASCYTQLKLSGPGELSKPLHDFLILNFILFPTRMVLASSLSGCRPYWLTLLVLFPSPSIQMPGQYNQLCRERLQALASCIFFFGVLKAKIIIIIIIIINTTMFWGHNRDKWVTVTVISGSLSPRHGASSGCGWRNGLQIWKVAVNVLNKQSRTADKGWSCSLGVGRGANNSSRSRRPVL